VLSPSEVRALPRLESEKRGNGFCTGSSPQQPGSPSLSLLQVAPNRTRFNLKNCQVRVSKFRFFSNKTAAQYFNLYLSRQSIVTKLAPMYLINFFFSIDKKYMHCSLLEETWRFTKTLLFSGHMLDSYRLKAKVSPDTGFYFMVS
jgi:hypothetical protein